MHQVFSTLNRLNWKRQKTLAGEIQIPKILLALRDVTEGVFSFYSEISVRNGSIQGYVKPLFRNLDVYDKRQDRDKNLFQKIYEGIIGGLSWVLENDPRDEVATQTEISGQLSNPETSTFDVVIGLVQNAFFKAILPGLEREIRTGRKR